MAAKMGMKLGLGGSRLLQQSAARRLGAAGRRPLSVAAAAGREKGELKDRLPGESSSRQPWGCSNERRSQKTYKQP
jgi:hypothetical protein